MTNLEKLNAWNLYATLQPRLYCGPIKSPLTIDVSGIATKILDVPEGSKVKFIFDGENWRFVDGVFSDKDLRMLYESGLVGCTQYKANDLLIELSTICAGAVFVGFTDTLKSDINAMCDKYGSSSVFDALWILGTALGTTSVTEEIATYIAKTQSYSGDNNEMYDAMFDCVVGFINCK